MCRFNAMCHKWDRRDFNTMRPRQNGWHFPDDILKCIFLNENIWILIKISLKFVPKGPINYIPALVQIMAWRRPGDKPLSEPMMVSLLTHICVTRPQWVNCTVWYNICYNLRQMHSTALLPLFTRNKQCTVRQDDLFEVQLYGKESLKSGVLVSLYFSPLFCYLKESHKKQNVD